MYALKVLGLFQTTSVEQTSWAQLLSTRVGTGSDKIEKLRKILNDNNVVDPEAAIEAINWLRLFDHIPLG